MFCLAEDNTEKAVDHIPGSSPSSQNQTDNTEMPGHKIPTLGSSDHYANATNTEQEGKNEFNLMKLVCLFAV